MFTPAIDFETPSSRAVTWRVQPPLDCLICASDKENRRLGKVPESVAGGLSMSGFWPSRTTSPGTGSVPPTPGALIGSRGCAADCPVEAASTAPAAVAVERISLRENSPIFSSLWAHGVSDGGCFPPRSRGQGGGFDA